MIFKTLGTFDFVTVLLLIGASIFPQTLLIYAALYLLIKGLFFIAFSNDFASYGDAISGSYMILMAYSISFPIATTIVILYLGQKTFFTFVKIGLEFHSIYHFVKNTKNSNGKTNTFDYYMR